MLAVDSVMFFRTQMGMPEWIHGTLKNDEGVFESVHDGLEDARCSLDRVSGVLKLLRFSHFDDKRKGSSSREMSIRIGCS